MEKSNTVCKDLYLVQIKRCATLEQQVDDLTKKEGFYEIRCVVLEERIAKLLTLKEDYCASLRTLARFLEQTATYPHSDTGARIAGLMGVYKLMLTTAVTFEHPA